MIVFRLTVLFCFWWSDTDTVPVQNRWGGYLSLISTFSRPCGQNSF
jgi:hypothetical protein